MSLWSVLKDNSIECGCELSLPLGCQKRVAQEYGNHEREASCFYSGTLKQKVFDNPDCVWLERPSCELRDSEFEHSGIRPPFRGGESHIEKVDC
jgi:hypothetical protein